MRLQTNRIQGRPRGSAMLMVLWGMMLMAMAVGGLVLYMRDGVLDDVDEAKAFQARLLAESGLALAFHPNLKKSDPLLRQQVSPLKRYEVKSTTEGSRVAINQIAAKADVHDSCRRLFILWGLDPEKSGILADSLKDWVDADDRVSPLGAEDGHYLLRGAPDFPINGPFGHLDEMLFVRGMPELARRKPDWRRYFTLYGDGLIDINEASAELLEIVCEVPRPQAEMGVLFRLGPDLLADTEDDELYEDYERFQEALGLSRWDFAKIEPRLTLNHPIRRVVSTGQAGDYRVSLTAIVGPGLHLIEEKHHRPARTSEEDELSRDPQSP